MSYIYEINCENESYDWVDSRWLDEEAATDEFWKLADEAYLEDTVDKEILTITLFRRALNKSGNGDPYWNYDSDEKMLCVTRNTPDGIFKEV